ncbi:MAG: glycosyltransferase family A protein [Candidatus Dependentiae bacterium]
MKRLLFILVFNVAANFAMSDQIEQAVLEHIVNGQKEIAVVVPTYNNSRKNVCIKNIDSILSQDYENYHLYIIDDVSTDDTFDKLYQYINDHSNRHKVTLIKNNKRVGAMANFYNTIYQIEDHVIVINIDGDDWLPHEQVLSYINDVYANPNVWLTYGQYKEFPRGEIGFCRGYGASTIEQNAFRQCGLPISHLRTYYAWLFKKLKKEDLMYNGNFVQVTCDKVMMVPMIEMCGGRFRCLDDILYIYNAVNPISDMRVHGIDQGKIRDRIFKMRPYEPLAEIITDFATDVQ